MLLASYRSTRPGIQGVANPAIFVGVMLAQLAPWLPLLTGAFAAICAWNAWQIVKLRRNS